MKRFALGMLVLCGMMFAIAGADSFAQDKKEEPKKDEMKKDDKKKDDKKDPKKDPKAKLLTIKQIMSKGNAAVKDINAQLKGEPKWDVVLAKAKVASAAVADLPKNSPKKGDAESWKKLSEEYAAVHVKLEEAADKKDLDATKAAVKEIGGSCKACHDAHKGK